MDGEDDYCGHGRERKTNASSRGAASASDLMGDMSFMMLDYIKDAMKVHDTQ